MYGDESPAASPLRRAMPASVSREDLVKEYELIYTPKDGPTSQRDRLANGGETMDIPPPPMPSRSAVARSACTLRSLIGRRGKLEGRKEGSALCLNSFPR